MSAALSGSIDRVSQARVQRGSGDGLVPLRLVRSEYGPPSAIEGPHAPSALSLACLVMAVAAKQPASARVLQA